MDWTGLDWTGLDWTGLDWTRLDWTGLDWTGLDWTGLDGRSPADVAAVPSTARTVWRMQLQEHSGVPNGSGTRRPNKHRHAHGGGAGRGGAGRGGAGRGGRSQPAGSMDRRRRGRTFGARRTGHPCKAARTHARMHAHARTRAQTRTHARARTCSYSGSRTAVRKASDDSVMFSECL